MKVIFDKLRQHDYSRQIDFLNRYSLLFHAVLSCMLVLVIEICSRRSFTGAFKFLGGHAFAFFFNSLIIFSTLMAVYLFRRRMLMRIVISSVWLLLGIINGCVLSQRVTPFGYTDLKCISDLLTMTNTQYFTKFQEICVIILLCLLALFLVFLALKGRNSRGIRTSCARLHRVPAWALFYRLLHPWPIVRIKWLPIFRILHRAIRITGLYTGFHRASWTAA